MNKELLDYCARFIEKAQKHALVLEDERSIPYGVQLKLYDSGDRSVVVNIYHSEKKGFSLVVGGKRENPLREKIMQISNEINNPKESLHNWQTWLGTDESGKGDFFGPLVVVGFVADEKNMDRYINLGIKDSKKISDREIFEKAKLIYSSGIGRIEKVVLNPNKYNELYGKFASQGKKLNELLGWMHARVIVNISGKMSIDGVVIDKFARERTVRNAILSAKKLSFMMVEEGERDIAVAAASILARYHFLKTLAEMEKQYNMKFPKGAGSKVKEAAKQFAKKYGKERLIEVAKIHFKTYNEV
jgi:ribonuclease HIII